MADEFHDALSYPHIELPSNVGDPWLDRSGLNGSHHPDLWVELTPMIRIPLSSSKIRSEVFQALQEMYLDNFLFKSGPIPREFVNLISNPIDFQKCAKPDDLHPIVYYLAGLTRDPLNLVISKLSISSPISIILNKINAMDGVSGTPNGKKESVLESYSSFTKLYGNDTFLSKLYELVCGNELYIVMTLIICTLHALCRIFDSPLPTYNEMQDNENLQKWSTSRDSSGSSANFLNTIHEMRLRDYLDSKILEVEMLSGQLEDLNPIKNDASKSDSCNLWSLSNFETGGTKSIWDTPSIRKDSPFTPEFLSDSEGRKVISKEEFKEELKKQEERIGANVESANTSKDIDSSRYQSLKAELFGSIYDLYRNKNVVPMKELFLNEEITKKIDLLTSLLLAREKKLTEEHGKSSRDDEATDGQKQIEPAIPKIPKVVPFGVENNGTAVENLMSPKEVKGQNYLPKRTKVLKGKSKHETRNTNIPSVPTPQPHASPKSALESTTGSKNSSIYQKISDELFSNLRLQNESPLDTTPSQAFKEKEIDYTGLNKSYSRALEEFSEKWAEKNGLKFDTSCMMNAALTLKNDMVDSKEDRELESEVNKIDHSKAQKKSTNAIKKQNGNRSKVADIDARSNGVATKEIQSLEKQGDPVISSTLASIELEEEPLDNDSEEEREELTLELEQDIDFVLSLFSSISKDTVEEMFRVCFYKLDSVLNLLFAQEIAHDDTISIVLDNMDEEEMNFEEQYLFAKKYFPNLTRQDLSTNLSKNRGNFKHTIQRIYFDDVTYFDASSTFQITPEISQRELTIPELGMLKELLPNTDEKLLILRLRKNNFDVNKAYESFVEAPEKSNMPIAEQKTGSWKKFDVDASKIQELTNLPLTQVRSYLHKNKGNFLHSLVDIILNYQSIKSGHSDQVAVKGGRIQDKSHEIKSNDVHLAADTEIEEYQYDPNSKEAQELRAMYLGNREFRENMSELFFERGLVFYRGDYSQLLNVAFLLCENNAASLLFGVPQKKAKITSVLEEFKRGTKMPERKLPLKVKSTEGRSNISQTNSMVYNGSEKLDLHGMMTKDAVSKAEFAVKKWWQLEQQQRIEDGRIEKFGSIAQFCQPLSIVVGKGIHSTGGKAKIKPGVTKMLEKNRYVFEDLLGTLVVLGKR